MSERDALSRRCPACGARPGQPCLSITSKASASEFVGKLFREETEMHEARKR